MKYSILALGMAIFLLGASIALGNEELPASRWPNDVLIASDRTDESLSMDVDYNDDLYLACTRYVMKRGDVYIDIYKSWDDGETWAVLKSFMFYSGGWIQPGLSLCITQNNVVVLFADDESDKYLWAYWVRKDLTDSNLVCVYADWSELVSVDNIDYNDDDLFAVFRGDHSNGNTYLMFCFSHDGGQIWSIPDTIAGSNSDHRPTIDGAVTTGMQGAAQKIFATAHYSLGNPIEINVWRSYSSGWDLVYQKTAGSGEHLRYPVIKALQNGSNCTVLLYYEKENSSGDFDLAYAYSTSSGDQGTWIEGTIPIPSHDQLSPQIGVGGYGHDYFYVSYWDWYPDGVERVKTVMHHKNDMNNPIIKLVSREAEQYPYGGYKYYKTDITWTLQSTTPIGAWFDGRNVLLDIYCNVAIQQGIEYSEIKKSFALQLRNNPNPFNSITQIEYSIPIKRPVQLRIYNSVGRLVKNLIQEEKEAGKYAVNWDIRGQSKGQLPNGIYFCKLKAGEFTETKKMVVMR